MENNQNYSGAALSPQITRDYHIVRLLGKGGMGEVYLAEQLRVGRRGVALKVLNRSCCDDAELKRRFENEASSAGRIHHRNVVLVYESRVTDDGQLYVAMEYVEGRDLGHVIEEQGVLSLQETVRIIKQVAAGLGAAHKLGIVHRDIKPANIMLTHDEDGSLLVKVLDFGIARLSEADSGGGATKTGVVMGTPHYMSPEQTLGQTGGKIDHRSDIYSLAMVAYQMLTGRVAFESDSWVQVMLKHVNEAPQAPSLTRPDLAHLSAIDKVIFKGLEKDREKRQQSAVEFANELEAACAGLGAPGPAGTDTARYSGGVSLPFAGADPGQPSYPAQPAANTEHIPTVLTTPPPVSPTTDASQAGAVSTPAAPPTATAGREAESYETVAMRPPRPTAVAGGAIPPVAVEMPSRPVRGPSSTGKRIAGAASAVILLALAAAAYFVLHGRGKPSEPASVEAVATSNLTQNPSPNAEQSGVGSSPSPSAASSPSPSESKNAGLKKDEAREKEEKEKAQKEQMKENQVAAANPLTQETPKPGRNPHEALPASTPLAVTKATPPPAARPTPVTPAATQANNNAENCIGVLVMNAQGSAVQGAFVTVTDETSGGQQTARTGPMGRDRFCQLVPGHRYSVTVVGPKGVLKAHAERVLHAGANPVQIQLQ